MKLYIFVVVVLLQILPVCTVDLPGFICAPNAHRRDAVKAVSNKTDVSNVNILDTEVKTTNDVIQLDIVGSSRWTLHNTHGCEVTVMVKGGRDNKLRHFSTRTQSFAPLQETRHVLEFERNEVGTIEFVEFETQTKDCVWRPEHILVHNGIVNYLLPCTESIPQKRSRREISRALTIGVQTYDEYWAGTDAEIYLYIYGRTGSSGKRILPGEYYVGEYTTSTLTVGDIGVIYRIRFGHNNEGSGAGYKLDYVKITEAGEGTYRFDCACWIEDDNLFKVLDVNSECAAISNCASQRCVTCDLCDDSDGTYFYALRSDKRECFRCSHIDKCVTENCPSHDGQTCSRCEGVVIDSPGSRAYVPSDDRRSCKKTCSWLPDSTYCYPGSCPTELPESCDCASGFTGSKCETMTEKPTVLWNRLVFSRTATDEAEAPYDPNTVTEQEKSWTNLKDIQTVECEFKSTYTQSGIVPDRPPYIKDYMVGIAKGTINFKFFRGGSEVTGRRKSLTCSGASSSSPKQGLYTCVEAYSIPTLAPSPLQTDDEFQFEFVTENGGYVEVLNLQTDDVATFVYTGKSETTTVKMGLDYDLPYHCLHSSCTEKMLSVVGVTSEATLSLSWDGWADDLSGLQKYTVAAFEMEYIVSVGGLRNKRLELMEEYETDILQADVTLGEKGIYAVELAAYDKAGNYRTARRIVIYDDGSEITTVPDTVLRVTSAAESSEWEWQWTKDSVTVDWTTRYINVLHDNKKWLEVVTSIVDVDDLYDDHDVARGIDAIENVQGIVEFKTAYETDHAGGTTLTSTPEDSAFTSLVRGQTDTVSPQLEDGDTLRYWVRAYDIRGEYLEEIVTVHIDTTPPIIQDLWLTRGDRLNIAVHSIEELSKMTIEWESYDDHSGLETVSWRLFDNFTNTDIVHGVQHTTTQGDAIDLSACNSKYGSYPRGSNCYCTPHVGCYHRHYQVKPFVIADSLAHGGVFQSKDLGVHDYDYFLEVTVMNHAHLTSKLDFQVTVDASPPHGGVVHDGQTDNPEVDYQSDLELHAHWEGFFDKESGVKFYQYGFAEECLQPSAFALDLSTVQITETFSTHASWSAPSAGTYYITVVAYNSALDASLPVCSDGVTIDQTGPVISQIAVLNSRTTEGLVKKTNGEVWVISDDRRKSQVENPDAICIQKAKSVSDIDLDLVPQHVTADGSVLTHLSASCDEYPTFRLSDVNTFYLSKDQFLYVNWTGSDADSGIYDYELGLMLNPSAVGAPNLLAYTSTHNHRHYQGFHPAVSEGQVFYIAVKATNRAGLSTTKILGPITVHLQPPSVSGSITVSSGNNLLITEWSPSIISDPEMNYLQYEYAVGTKAGGTDILEFRALQIGGTCTASSPPSCTAAAISQLLRNLHDSHTYYVSIKVTNIVGLSSIVASPPYTHQTRSPSGGVVFDISPDTEWPLFDITEFEDSDFQLLKTSLASRWYGFDDGLTGVSYRVCVGTAAGTQDVQAFVDVGEALSHQFVDLNLQLNQKYYVTVVGANEAGEMSQSSDGVEIIEENISLDDVTVQDGEESDLAFQASSSMYSVKWTTTTALRDQYPDAHVKFEKRETENSWTTIRDYENLGLSEHATVGDLTLDPGQTYRAAVKFCAVRVCTSPVYSDGVTVIPHPPVSDGVTVTYSEAGEESQLAVTMDRFRDPDIARLSVSYAVMERYEWSVTDNSHSSSLLIPWTAATGLSVDGDKVTFSVSLSKHLTFTKCHRLAIRGYNKVGAFTIVSADIKDCKAFDPLLIIPSTVIDALGPQSEQDAEGEGIVLELNAQWPVLDVDYTPYKNILSALWPGLRHHQYKWAVVSDDVIDPTFHFKKTNIMTQSDPCSLPNVVKCGETDKEYVNVHFNDSLPLLHGKRYYICIHADEKTVTFEKWPTVLDEVNTCSDGVTVDLTPPSPGSVTVDRLHNAICQVSRTEVSVTWDGFTDVEESGSTPHHRGISHYQLALGSIQGGEDILAMTNVGLVNHFTATSLALLDGQTIYATVKAHDFVNKTISVSSAAFIVDSSPPQTTERQILIGERYVASSTVETCWEGVFLDEESGIDYYEVSFGSRPGRDDIIPLTHVKDICQQFDIPPQLGDGHSFYITVKAFNLAGLSRSTTSHSFVVDASPPTVGQVFDGTLATAVDAKMDKDYVTSVDHLGAHWEGFSDPHSYIKHFTLKVGICPGCDDAVAEYDSAARTDVVFSDGHATFKEGVKYFVTVTACNKAGLCSSASSDGFILDRSPPVSGRVMDGTQDRDIQYQASRLFLGCKWYGFQDPESGLDFYEWRVGTSRGEGEILSPKRTALKEISFHSLPQASQLPLGQKLYCTVRAYNKAGAYSESSSNGFIVDASPPVILRSPGIEAGQGSVVAMTLISRTSIRISWQIEDEESFIETQHISISSHQLGEFNPSSVKLPGLLREFTYTKLDLHDGSLYKVKVTACNMAGLCTTATSGEILVDGSKPKTGALAVETDHSAELSRHQSDAMTWSTTSLTLAWLGFADLHSGIDHYIITVGSQPFGTDLAQSELPNTVSHDPSGADRADEGVVQVFTVNTKDLSALSSVFVAVWAVNGVGLESSALHHEMTLGEGRQLELVRRCSPFVCEGHCVCAKQEKTCALSTGCTQLTNGGSNSGLTVNDVISLSSLNPAAAVDVDYSPSDTFLAATWTVTTHQGLAPVRYEFSAGVTDLDSPSGIFNVATDRVWFDAGTRQATVMVFGRGEGIELTPGLKFSVFVRAWYDTFTYSIFKSDGVLIDNRAPTFTEKLGMAIKEHKTSSGGKDIDFQTFTDRMYISWAGKFLPGDSGLLKYRVYVSTSPGGHSIHSSADRTSTSYTVTGLSLEQSTLYFSCVLAYNRAGLVGWTYSDGLTPDIAAPVTGSIKDGDGLQDIDFQSSPSDICASWCGFSDLDSTIVRYSWCVGTVDDTVDCSILGWQDVGLHTSASKRLTSPIPTGTKLWTKVRAEDAVGHVSGVAVSDGVVIDATPPKVENVAYRGDNIVLNPSFEADDGAAESTLIECNHLIPQFWDAGPDSCVKILTPEAPNAKHNKTHISLSGRIQQTITGLNTGQPYLLIVHVGYPETLTVNHKAVEGLLAFGHEVFTFSLDPQLCKGVCSVEEQTSVLWYTLTYKLHAEDTSALLSIGTESRSMGMVLDYISVQKIDYTGDASSVKTHQHVMLHPVFLSHWSSVHASWHFTDEESPITEYTWAAGTVPGGTQIQKYVSVGRHSHGTLSGLRLRHNQTLYLTVTARNAAGLTTVSYPDPITVDMTPPVFTSIIDGTDVDIDYQGVGDVAVTWSVGDDETGINHCDWAIGTTPGRSDIKKFETVAPGQTSAELDFNDILTSSSLKVYTTVRCFNSVGRMAVATTDGVTVIKIDTSPTVTGLEVMKDQVPYLYGKGDCHTAGDVRLRWARDALQDTVIESSDDVTVYQSAIKAWYEFGTVSGLSMTELGTYNMHVFPRLIIGVDGDVTPVPVPYHGPNPIVEDENKILVTRAGNNFTLSWSDVFKSPWEDLLYAVHVGSVLGGADILERNIRTEPYVTLTLTSVRPTKTRAYISVTAVDPCGFTQHYTQTFNIDI